MSLDATLKCVPAGISIPDARVNDVSAIRLKDTRNISLVAMRAVKLYEWKEKGQTKSRRRKALRFFEKAVHLAELFMRVSLPATVVQEYFFDFLA